MSALPTNISQAHRFIDDEPAWEKPVRLAESYDTSINLTRAGLETRNRRRLIPRRQLEFTVSAVTNDEYQARAEAAQLDARAICWVPLWTDPEYLTADQTAAAYVNLEIGNDRRPGLFRVGDWVYLVDGADKQFRQIASKADEVTFTLEATGSPIEFLEGAAVYPCIACELVTRDIDFARFAPESREITLAFRSIGIPVTPASFATAIPTESTTRVNQDAGF